MRIGYIYVYIDFLLRLKAEESYDVPLNGGESFRRVPISSGSTLRLALPAPVYVPSTGV